MRAVMLRAHGGLDALTVEDVPDPIAGPGEAVVRVRAVAVNRLDCWVRADVGHAYQAQLPLIPGYDVAGEVVQIGAGVDTVAPGDRVYVHYDYSCGRCRYCLAGDESLCEHYGVMGVDHHGGYAELVVGPERNLFPLDARAFDRRLLYLVPEPPAPLVGGFMDRNAIDPGFQAGIGIEILDTAKNFDEDLLGGVGGVGRIVQNAVH